MKALVVYESMFGNTALIARAVADGLARRMSVEVSAVEDVSGEAADYVDLIVVGGPTHAWSMSRPRTRAAAVAKGGARGKVDYGLREWIATVPNVSSTSQLVTFDTKLTKARHLPGSAAKSARRVARRRGFSTLHPPETFYVTGAAGPLAEGELDRARAWGRSLAAVELAR